MTPPTATPRTDAALYLNGLEIVLPDFARRLETELACEKGNRNHLIEKGAKLETELDAEREKVRVLRGQLENASAYFAIRELGDPAKLLCGKIDAALAATKEGA